MADMAAAGSGRTSGKAIIIYYGAGVTFDPRPTANKSVEMESTPLDT